MSFDISFGLLPLHRKLWDAINRYAQACGGDTSEATVSGKRMSAVSEVSRLHELLLGEMGQRAIRARSVDRPLAALILQARLGTSCPACQGEGHLPSEPTTDDDRPCHGCGGLGCDRCEGEKAEDAVPCARCGGEGRILDPLSVQLADALEAKATSHKVSSNWTVLADFLGAVAQFSRQDGHAWDFANFLAVRNDLLVSLNSLMQAETSEQVTATAVRIAYLASLLSQRAQQPQSSSVEALEPGAASPRAATKKRRLRTRAGSPTEIHPDDYHDECEAVAEDLVEELAEGAKTSFRDALEKVERSSFDQGWEGALAFVQSEADWVVESLSEEGGKVRIEMRLRTEPVGHATVRLSAERFRYDEDTK